MTALCFRFTASPVLSLILLLGWCEALNAQFFTRVTDVGPVVTEAFISTGGSWNDFNNDGFPDLYALGEANRFYFNNGDGTFSSVTSGHFVTAPGFSNTGIWADYNNDGYQDLYLINFGTDINATSAARNFLYKNAGPPDFQMDTVSVGNDLSATASASWVDYDQDGDVDLFTSAGALSHGEATPDIFYRNDGNDTFSKQEQLSFLKDRTASSTHDVWVDYDRDGDLDVYIVNWRQSNELYKSMLMETGNPNLFQSVSSSGLTSERFLFDIGSSWGDYDNDGDLDVFIPFTSRTRDRLYQNNGDGTFTSITNTPIVTNGTSTTFGVWGDYDNDGDLDLFTAQFGTPAPPRLYRNDGQGVFTNTTSDEVGEILTSLPAAQSGYWGDYDSDGDLDMYVMTFALPPNPSGLPQPDFLIRNNEGNSNNWLTVKGIGDVSNRSAVGATIRVKATIQGTPSWQMRTVSGGTSSFLFQGEQRAHFGLGDAPQADSLVIEWPSGIVQVLENVAANQFLTVTEAVPEGFLRPVFYGDVTSGQDQLTVQFNDVSLVDENNPVLTWAWDLDHDGVVDSNEENPTWTYTASEDTAFSVKLTVSNGTVTDSLIRENYITLAGITTGTGLVPRDGILSFTLGANFPNPFPDRTTIEYALENPGWVR